MIFTPLFDINQFAFFDTPYLLYTRVIISKCQIYVFQHVLIRNIQNNLLKCKKMRNFAAN